MLDDVLPPTRIDEATRGTLWSMSDDAKGWVIAAVSVVLSVVFTGLGVTWYLASTMATKADIAEVRDSVDGLRREMNEHMRELRQYLMDHVDGHPTDD